MISIKEKTLRSAKVNYLREILFDYELGHCDSREVKHVLHAVIDEEYDRFFVLMDMASEEGHRYLDLIPQLEE